MLFLPGEFSTHSGQTLPWKIECDSLTNTEIGLFADLILKMFPESFTAVVGIPRGGLRLASAILDRIGPVGGLPARVLLVDDVLTTGKSMESERRKIAGAIVSGTVMFARGSCPDWIRPVFMLHKELI